MASVEMATINPALLCAKLHGDEFHIPKASVLSLVVAASANLAAAPTNLYGGIVGCSTGSVVLTLPVGQVGMNFIVVCTAAQTAAITAITPDYISVEGVAGAAAGTLTSAAVIGNAIRVTFLGGNCWYVDRIKGTWTAS
jgi:hypothetical protein